MKLFIIVLFIIYAAITANAQVNWGVRAGTNLSNINRHERGVKVDGYQMRLGYTVGAMLEYTFWDDYDKAWSLQPELLFTNNGTNYKLYDWDGNIFNTGALVFNEFTLPVNLKYRFVIKNQNVFCSFGTYFGYITKASDNPTGISSINLLNLSGYSRFNCGISAGVGVTVRKFIFDLRYQHGVVDITRPQNDVNTKIRSFVLTVGYFLGR